MWLIFNIERERNGGRLGLWVQSWSSHTIHLLMELHKSRWNSKSNADLFLWVLPHVCKWNLRKTSWEISTEVSEIYLKLNTSVPSLGRPKVPLARSRASQTNFPRAGAAGGLWDEPSREGAVTGSVTGSPGPGSVRLKRFCGHRSAERERKSGSRALP